MDEYDNIRRMPGSESTQDAKPFLNLRSLSLLSEDGHLTVTFWLLAAAIVVAIYLVIEMLEQHEEVEAPHVIEPIPQDNQNHHSPTRTRKTTEKASTDASNQ